MTISDRKQVIRALGIFFMLWGIINIPRIESFYRASKTRNIFQIGIYENFLIFFVILSSLTLLDFITSFRVLTFKKGARVLAIVLSIVSSLELMGYLYNMCYLFFLPTIINRSNYTICIWILYPDNWELLFCLISIPIFICSVIVMFQKNTKLIFELKGNTTEIEQQEVRPKRFRIILLAIILIILFLQFIEFPRHILLAIGRMYQ